MQPRSVTRSTPLLAALIRFGAAARTAREMADGVVRRGRARPGTFASCPLQMTGRRRAFQPGTRTRIGSTSVPARENLNSRSINTIVSSRPLGTTTTPLLVRTSSSNTISAVI